MVWLIIWASWRVRFIAYQYMLLFMNTKICKSINSFSPVLTGVKLLCPA